MLGRGDETGALKSSHSSSLGMAWNEATTWEEGRPSDGFGTGVRVNNNPLAAAGVKRHGASKHGLPPQVACLSEHVVTAEPMRREKHRLGVLDSLPRSTGFGIAACRCQVSQLRITAGVAERHFVAELE
jgi:hypothetical protein